MSDELIPYGGLPSRMERKAVHEIVRARTRGAVVAARQIAKVEAVAEVTKRAVLANAEVTMLEQALAAQNPAAAARLNVLADAGCVAMAGIVHQTGGRWW